MFDLQKASSGAVIEAHEQACCEKGILISTDAPEQELRSAQRKVDALQEELLRRMAW